MHVIAVAGPTTLRTCRLADATDQEACSVLGSQQQLVRGNAEHWLLLSWQVSGVELLACIWQHQHKRLE
jgi:hypothetical protein